MTKEEILKRYFGYDSFRQGQEYLINNIMNKKDCLGIMPTGAGKSICFQVPALMMDGITLIISPLISLMKDQVNTLIQAGIPAAYINSSLTERQIHTATERAKQGRYKMIYIAPERLLTYEFLKFAQNTKISMVTVDEAHCISQWGQDFRPSYAKIPEFIEHLSYRPVMSAFTATATPKVKEDMLNILKLDKPAVLVTGFNRENLYFEVQKPKNKLIALLKILDNRKDKSGIVYCNTRKTVEEVSRQLNENGYKALPYHAGLESVERQDNQEDFLYDRVKIMVATNAFGMGIDKSNVSFVVHYNMPKDIESYYQEAGRAGRDGESADCILLYSGQDVRTNQWLIDNSDGMEYPDEETEQQLKERDRQRLKKMTLYCLTNDCLRSYILRYFGEIPENYCGNCSNCNANFETVDVTLDAKKVLSCVYRMNEHYGIKMVIDVLRGKSSERLLNNKLDMLPTYGICSLSEKRLHELIDYLIINEYLIKTDDKYPILKLGKFSVDILHKGKKIQMKQAKEDNVRKREKEKPEVLYKVNQELFNALRELRQKIADVQSVPAFVIFSDKTLTDMCVRMPENEHEMLAVSGVGQVKYNHYGKKFLKVIAEYK